MGWQDGALAVALNYGEGETMFVSGRIYINLGTCEIWGHLFALLKNLKHEQHKSPTGCWQCFTKQLLTWSLESDLMKLFCCNFAYMRRQWSFAESSCPSGSRKGNCKKNLLPIEMQGHLASDVWILTSLPSNFEYTIRNFKLNRVLK